jgi:DNA-binding response OmpR family regulator
MPRLLVADDDSSWRSLYRLEFERAWEVVEAQDGVEALRLADALPPDLVILDLQMPRLDGFGVLRRLRLRGCLAPVILCSAVSPADVPFLASGVRVVEKSPDLGALHAAVQALLGGSAPLPKGEAPAPPLPKS